MVKSDYIASFVLGTGDNRFVFYPLTITDGSKIYLRGTGDTVLTIEKTELESGLWNTISTNWDGDPNLWGI